MLLNLFYTIFETFYTLLSNTDLDLSYFDLSYVFPGHIDSVERGFTVYKLQNTNIFLQIQLILDLESENEKFVLLYL